MTDLKTAIECLPGHEKWADNAIRETGCDANLKPIITTVLNLLCEDEIGLADSLMTAYGFSEQLIKECNVYVFA